MDNFLAEDMGKKGEENCSPLQFYRNFFSEKL